MIKVMNFECFSEQGIRENNEDYLLPHVLEQQQRVFVLCDGMGGHGHGEVASQTVCESVYMLFYHRKLIVKAMSLQKMPCSRR